MSQKSEQKLLYGYMTADRYDEGIAALRSDLGNAFRDGFAVVRETFTAVPGLGGDRLSTFNVMPCLTYFIVLEKEAQA